MIFYSDHLVKFRHENWIIDQWNKEVLQNFCCPCLRSAYQLTFVENVFNMSVEAHDFKFHLKINTSGALLHALKICKPLSQANIAFFSKFDELVGDSHELWSSKRRKNSSSNYQSQNCFFSLPEWKKNRQIPKLSPLHRESLAIKFYIKYLGGRLFLSLFPLETGMSHSEAIYIKMKVALNAREISLPLLPISR